MSALGGIYSFAGGFIDTGKLASLGEALSVRGPDGGREVVSGHIGFSYRALHTNRESRLEDQPFVCRAGHILVWDGRLDNRKELSDQIGLSRHAQQGCVTDVEIVMAAYLKWGENFLPNLIGDFALTLWDPILRKLLLARDPVGVRSLYYRCDRERFDWSSDLTALMSLSPAESDIDEDYIAGFLSFSKDTARTPFVKYKAVRPGHVVAVDHSGFVRERMFWKLNPDAEIRFPRDSHYEERFRELFEAAVGSRLRSDSPVMAELSGGLDSSSIVCAADRLIRSGAVEAPRLELISHVSDECATSDERRFIHCVEEHVQLTSNYLRQDDYPFLTPLADTSRISTINPYLTNAGYLNGMKVLMRDKGTRIRLSGVGGDELLHSVNDPTPELSELLVNWKFLSLFRRLKVWGPLLREPYGNLFWSKAVLPSLPLRVQALIKSEKRLYVPAWMDQDFVARTRLRERVVSTPDIYGFRNPTGRDQSTGFLSVANTISLGHYPEAFDHEMSYPFLHRPLVEFLCAIPFEQLLRPGESRSLMRRSLVGLLPGTILRRKGKGNSREIVGVVFERQWPKWRRLFDDPLVARYGFVDLARMREAIDRIRHGFVIEARQLVSIMTLEVWLRIIEERTRFAREKRVNDSFMRTAIVA
jgi:asparagine synthase (glutamine-hydrolysing)